MTAPRKPRAKSTKPSAKSQLPLWKPTPVKVGRPSDYRPEFCKLVVEMGCVGAGKAEMAAACGCSRDTFLHWQENNPEFLDAVKAATYLSQAWWEREGRKATFGAVPGFNQTSFIFTMKNMFGDDWREKIEHAGTGAGGAIVVRFQAEDQKIM